MSDCIQVKIERAWKTKIENTTGPYLPAPPCTVLHALRVWTPKFAAEVNSNQKPSSLVRPEIFRIIKRISKYTEIYDLERDPLYQKLTPELDKEMSNTCRLLEIDFHGLIFTPTPFETSFSPFWTRATRRVGCFTMLSLYRGNSFPPFQYIIPTALLTLIPTEFLSEEPHRKTRCLNLNCLYQIPTSDCGCNRHEDSHIYEFRRPDAAQIFDRIYPGKPCSVTWLAIYCPIHS